MTMSGRDEFPAGGRNAARRRLSRRVFLAVLGGAGAWPVLSACAGQQQPPSRPGGAAAPAPGAPAAPAAAPSPAAAVAPVSAPSVGSPVAQASPAAAASTGKRGGTLNWYLPDDPPDLDPHMQTTSSLQWVSGMVYNGLVKFDVKPGNTPETPGASTVVPDLAERWEQNDPLTYTFYLRKGVKFHNGTEMTAEDAVFSLDRIRTRKPEFQRAYAFEPVEKVEAVDRYTVRVTMKAPYAPFIYQMATAYTRVAPKAVIEQQGDLKQGMVGTGPFKLKEYQRGNRFVLERNPDYFDPNLPRVDSVVLRILPDSSAQLAAFNSKQIDIYTPSSVQEFHQLKQTMAGLGTSSFIDGSVNGIGLNVSQKPFDDIRVRQALWYAIDQEEITKVVWSGQGWKHRAVPASMPEWAEPFETLPLSDTPNLEKAKALLAEAGYPNGFETECKTIYRYTAKEAQVVAQQLAKIGVKVNLVETEYGAYLAARNKGDFQMIAFALSPFGDVEDFTQALFQREQSRNFGKWGTAELDKLFEDGRKETDVPKRKAIYKQIQQELARQCFILDLPRGYNYELWHPYVKDYVSATNVERGLPFTHVWLDK